MPALDIPVLYNPVLVPIYKLSLAQAISYAELCLSPSGENTLIRPARSSLLIPLLVPAQRLPYASMLRDLTSLLMRLLDLS